MTAQDALAAEAGSPSEGVIQFGYSLSGSMASFPPQPWLAALGSWRTILQRLDLVGQSPERYDGFAYGNVSMRLPGTTSAFLISASQTSGLATVSEADWVVIEDVDLATFQVRAHGIKPPSSETITHAMIYAADASIRVVLHVHSARIWQQATLMPGTPAGIRYGSPDLAGAMTQLLGAHTQRPLVFVTRGHEDGVFACGPGLDETASALLACYAAACAT